MDFNINDISFEQIPESIVEIWEKLAEAKSHYDYLDSMAKTVLSGLGNGSSEAERNRTGLSHPDYKTHLQWVKQAQREFLTYQAWYKALDTRFEYCRSENATERARINLR